MHHCLLYGGQPNGMQYISPPWAWTANDNSWRTKGNHSDYDLHDPRIVTNNGLIHWHAQVTLLNGHATLPSPLDSEHHPRSIWPHVTYDPANDVATWSKRRSSQFPFKCWIGGPGNDSDTNNNRYLYACTLPFVQMNPLNHRLKSGLCLSVARVAYENKHQYYTLERYDTIGNNWSMCTTLLPATACYKLIYVPASQRIIFFDYGSTFTKSDVVNDMRKSYQP
jgi:hypothetical protein